MGLPVWPERGEISTEQHSSYSRGSSGADRCSNMTDSNPNAQATTPRIKGRESSQRLGLFLSLGAIAIYLSTWMGAVAFHVSFQQPLLALERGPGHGVLWLQPQPALPAGSEPWATETLEGFNVPIPPGRILEKRSEKTTLGLQLEEVGASGEVKSHAVTIELRPVGFLTSIHREKQQFLGVKTGDHLGDASVLEDLARGNLQTYRFGWNEEERSRYAALLLAKMSLWDTGPVTRFEFASRGSTRAALVEKPSGEARVIVAGDKCVLIVTLPAGVPEAWKNPASWLGN